MKQELKVLLGIGFTTLVLMFGAVWFFTKTSTPASSEIVDQNLLIKEDSPSMGPSECESCRAMYPVVKDLMTEYDGKIRLVVRYMPLHSNSVLAATVTEAAGEQGKYWEMQQKLFENQSQWGEKQTPQRELFIGYAKELGLDLQKFEASLSDPKYATKIQRDKNDGETLGVRATPTFFINGQQIETLSVPAIKAKIEEELGK
jgi:protein-disulfide isomerase